MSTRPVRPQLSPAQRVQQAVMGNQNQAVNCPKCGGIYLIEVKAQMYTGAGYGYRPVSQNPMNVYLCPCGALVMPSATAAPAGSERQLFNESIKVSENARAANSPDAMAKNVASVSELEAVKRQLAELTKQFNALVQGDETAQVESEFTEVPEGEVTDKDIVAETEQASKGTELPAHERPPIAAGNRGISTIAGTSPVNGDVKIVEDPTRQVAQGGARARLKRQGA